MKKKSLQFKLIAGGLIAVILPLFIVGVFAVYRSMGALEEIAMSRSMEVAKGLSQMATVTVEEEMKFVSQIAQRASVVAAAEQYNAGIKTGPEIDRVTADIIAVQKSFEKDYDAIFIAGLDGQLISSEGTNVNIASREYFQMAKSGKINAGAVVRSLSNNNVILTFAAPVRSATQEIIGVAVTIVKIRFLIDKVSATTLGKTGYGYVIDKTGMVIAHPNTDFILKMNLAQQEGVKEFTGRMMKGETGAAPYTFQGVKKVAGFAPVPITGWSICLTQDYGEFMTPVYGLVAFMTIVGLIFLALTAGAVYVLARNITLPIGNIAHDLNEASEQVSSASDQVAQSSQMLAEGATEQASGLEETSSSLEEMSSMTRRNADNAAEAKALMNEIKGIVDKVDKQMNSMTASIQDVTRSSEETGKIIKTIDEIAFQTNLLALNAAVEAARAGEAGAGFAVVADEVRNLAMRSAEAAKNTSELIENTISTVRASRDLTEQTQSAFKENVAISGKVVNLVAEIAAASSEQAQGIGQISKAVAEMDKVVQNTAASAEESASAAEQMHAQAQQMKGYVKHLTDIIHGGADAKSASRFAGKEKPASGGSMMIER